MASLACIDDHLKMALAALSCSQSCTISASPSSHLKKATHELHNTLNGNGGAFDELLMVWDVQELA